MSKVKNNASLLSDGFVSMSIDQITLPLENIGANLTSSFGINLSGDVDFSSGNYNISGSSTSTGSFGSISGDGIGSITNIVKDVVTDTSPKLSANIDLAGYTLNDTSYATVGNGNVDYRGIFQAINLPNTKLIVTSNNLPSGSSLLDETLDIQVSLTGSNLQISASKAITFASLLDYNDPRFSAWTSNDAGYGIVSENEPSDHTSAQSFGLNNLWAGDQTTKAMPYRVLTKSASFSDKVQLSGNSLAAAVSSKVASFTAAENLDAYVPVQMSSSGKIFALEDGNEFLGITNQSISQDSSGNVTLRGGIRGDIPASLITPSSGFSADQLSISNEIHWLTGSAQYVNEGHSLHSRGIKIGLAVKTDTILTRG
tara:strand:- start:68 stop:1177 length:1110 start_codon:yes stop_codon:yes gene_type:complete